MKAAILLGIVIYLTLSFSVPKKEFTLQEILTNPKFNVTSVSNGGHSKNSVKLKISSNYTSNINVVIPAGTVFYPENDHEQTLVAPVQQILAVKPNVNNFTLNGFCTEANDGCPKKDGAFTIGVSDNEKLTKLFNFIKDNEVDVHNMQEAIWCITDNESIANVYTEDTATNTKLKKLLSELTGQKIPWYNTKRNLEVDVNGNINRNPVELKGEVIFTTTKRTIIKSKIIDEQGELIHQYPRDFTVPKAIKDVELTFRVFVKGWKKGKYYVVYYTEEGTEIVKREFIV